MNSGIYVIQNKINDKSYIGSAKNIRTRWNKHKSDLRQNKSSQTVLQRAWNKYGELQLEFKILFYCEQDDLILFEQRVLNKYIPKYNVCKNAGSTLGYKANQITRQKHHKNMLGNLRAAKLNSDDVIEIRKRLATGDLQKDIASDYNMTRQAITAINNGDRWGWLEEKEG